MTDSISSFKETRILVLALSESHSSRQVVEITILSHTGLSFLEWIYLQSIFAAAVRSASQAARTLHDASIGKGTVFHLFRLPRNTERRIETALSERSSELDTRYDIVLY